MRGLPAHRGRLSNHVLLVDKLPERDRFPTFESLNALRFRVCDLIESTPEEALRLILGLRLRALSMPPQIQPSVQNAPHRTPTRPLVLPNCCHLHFSFLR